MSICRRSYRSFGIRHGGWIGCSITRRCWNGFRAELAAFRAVPVEGSGASTRVYALESTPGYDATPGQVAATGRNLDVAMKGAAWLAVQGLDEPL